MSEQTREAKITDLFNQLLAELNREPRGIGWHAGVAIRIPIPAGSNLALGLLNGSSFDVLSHGQINARFGMGNYRVGIFVIPDSGDSKLIAPVLHMV